MSELNTFGAIMTFSITLETQIRDYYQTAGDSTRAAEADKRRSSFERVRRENVTEIKLEAIEGLHEADYVLNLGDSSPAGRAAVERTAAEFYQAAAPKINVREAQRALERAAKQHAQNAAG